MSTEKAIELLLKFKIKGVEIELSIDDVKNLYETLGKLVGEKVVKEYVPYYPYVYHWTTSDKWWKQDEPYQVPYRVLCSGDNYSLTMEAKS